MCTWATTLSSWTCSRSWATNWSRRSLTSQPRRRAPTWLAMSSRSWPRTTSPRRCRRKREIWPIDQTRNRRLVLVTSAGALGFWTASKRSERVDSPSAGLDTSQKSTCARDCSAFSKSRGSTSATIFVRAPSPSLRSSLERPGRSARAFARSNGPASKHGASRSWRPRVRRMSTDNRARPGLPSRLAAGIGELDRYQRAALVAERNLVIVAGPGSGKTRTVVARAGYLLSARISPLRGLATITFTNQAATELKEGLARLGVVEPTRLFAGTLHSFCLAHVLPYARLVDVEIPGLDTLMNDSEEKALLQECADDEGVDYWAFRAVFTSLRRRLAAGEDVGDQREAHIRAVQR